MAKENIKIGCSAVLSGHEKVHGQAIVHAAQLAVEQANKKGILSTRLELVVDDDRDETAAAIEVAHRFVGTEQLIGVVGPMNSQAALAAAPIYQQADLVQISPAASNPDLTRMGYSAFFRVVAHDNFQGMRAAEFVVSHLKMNKLGVIHDGSTFGQPLSEVFAKRAEQLGAEILSLDVIRRGQQDYTKIARKMAACQPDLIFFGVIEAEGLQLAPQLRQAGVTAIFFGTDGLKSSRYLETPQYPFAGPYHSNASTDINVKESAWGFKNAFEHRFGPTYSVYSAEAFDAANILINAIARSNVVSRRSLMAQVANTDNYPGITGPISFDHNGDRKNPEIGFYELRPNKVAFMGFDRDLY
jgi:branched-chain amino acid transport system substrate-binding protein